MILVIQRGDYSLELSTAGKRLKLKDDMCFQQLRRKNQQTQTLSSARNKLATPGKPVNQKQKKSKLLYNDAILWKSQLKQQPRPHMDSGLSTAN